MSAERLETRRTLVVDEANAIDTAMLRSELLEPEQGAALRARLLEYLDTRISFYEVGVAAQSLAEVHARTEAQQTVIWRRVAEIARAAPDAETTALVLDNLNQMFDLAASRWAALESKDPSALVWVLLLVAVVSAGMLSSVLGPGRAHYAHLIVFQLMVAVVITLVIDIDRPRRGLILVSQAPLLELRESLSRPRATP
jgi:hypothetical protein